MNNGKRASYKVMSTFRSPKKGAGAVQYKMYEQGMSFVGECDEVNPSVVVDAQGYQVPAQYLQKTDDVVQDDSILPEGLSKKIDEIKNKDIVKEVLNGSKGSTHGALIGAVLGVCTALYYHKSVLLFGFAGLVVGGFIGNKIGKKINT